MSILAQQLKNPMIKPKWWGSLGLVESVVRYNCMKRGFPVPVLAMPFWEGAGNRTFDMSGKSKHGSATYGCSWKGNKILLNDQELLVSGGNGALSFLGKSFSVVWSCNVSDITTDYVGIASQWGSATDYREWGLIYIITTGVLTFYIDNGATKTCSANTAMTINTQDNRACVFTKGVKTDFYKNGIANGSPAFAYTPTLVTPRRAFIGGWSCDMASYSDAVYEFRGTMDYIYIFDVALTASQVKFLYDNPYFMFEMPEELWGYAAPTGLTILDYERASMRGCHRGIMVGVG